MIRLFGIGKIAWLVAILATLLSVSVVPVLAVVAYSASYSVQESGGIAYDMIAVSASAPNTWMAANGFMRSDALDTRIETADSATEYPHMVASDRTLAAVPLTANGQQNVFYTTRNSTATDMGVVLGYAGYATITDEATLEVGNDFSIEHDGWVDVDAVGATLLFKRDAFITYVSAAGTVSSSILGAVVATNPTGSADPGTIWANEALAYNDNGGDGADLGVVLQGVWSDYIEFTIASTWTQSVDFTAFTAALFTEAEVGVQYGGNWSVVYSGVFANGVATTINLYPNYVRPLTGMRLRFRNTSAGNTGEVGLLREVNLNAINQTWTVSAAGLTSGDMLFKTFGDATRFGIDIDGVTQDHDAAAFADTTGTSELGAGDLDPNNLTIVVTAAGTFTVTLPTLVTGTATSGTATVVGSPQALVAGANVVDTGATTGTFTIALTFTGIPNTATNWLLGGVATPYHNEFLLRSEGYYTFPTGNSDPGGTWNNETRAYDNDTNMIATTSVAAAGWSNYLVLTHASFVTNGLRYMTYGGTLNADYTSAEIDVTSDGVTWTNVATFDPIGGASTWADATFDTRTVTDVRIRGYRAGAGAKTFGVIELQWFGESQVWYQPNAIVTSSTLIDRASATANNAAITWGHNPVGILTNGTGTATGAPITLVVGANTITAAAGTFDTFIATMDGDNSSTATSGTATVSGSPQSMTLGGNTVYLTTANGTFIITSGGVGVTLGSMTADTQPAVGGTTTEPSNEVMPEITTGDWYVAPDVGGALLTNPFRPFVLMVSDNTTLDELQTWRWYGLIFVVMVTVAAAKYLRGHHFLTGISAGASIVVLVVMTIWPLWALVFVAGSVLGGMIAERMGNA